MSRGSYKQLLGSKKHIIERRMQKENHSCLLMPSHKFKTFWTIVIVVLMLYTAIWVPFRIAFIEDDTPFLMILDIIVDALFGIDIFINFISAIEDPTTGKIIMDHKQIA